MKIKTYLLAIDASENCGALALELVMFLHRGLSQGLPAGVTREHDHADTLSDANHLHLAPIINVIDLDDFSEYFSSRGLPKFVIC